MPKPPKPDYGIDAPAIRRLMLAIAAAGALLSALGTTLAAATSLTTPSAALPAAGLLATLYGLGLAADMTRSRRIAKLQTPDRLLNLAATLSPWTGHETVLDVGCGRSLMLIAPARRLTTGRAVGIDLWRPKDQSGTPSLPRLSAVNQED